MTKTTMLLGAALVALPSLLSAQTSVQAQGSAEVRVEQRQRAEAAERGAAGAEGHAAVRAAVEAGLPDAPVRRVIAEGEARNASDAAIDRAAARVVARLRVAREALRDEEGRREPSRAEIAAGAEALVAGAGRAELEKVSGAAAEGRSLVASLNALAELTARGVDGGAAAARIAAQLRAGASDQAIGGLAASLGSAASLGGGLSGTAGSLNAATSVTGAVSGSLGAVGGAASVGASVVGALGGGVR